MRYLFGLGSAVFTAVSIYSATRGDWPSVAVSTFFAGVWGFGAFVASKHDQ